MWDNIVKRYVKMRLKELRQKRKISQVKLAMDLSMNQNSISRYENGTREADYKTLIQFADYLMFPLIICWNAPTTRKSTDKKRHDVLCTSCRFLFYVRLIFMTTSVGIIFATQR